MVIVLAALIAAFGWRTALVVMGLTQLAVCIPLAISIRNRPQELGLQPDGVAVPWSPEMDAAGAVPVAESEGLTLRGALRSSAFWRFAISVALFNLGTTAIIVHQIPFFTSNVGLSEGIAAASVTAVTLLSIAGRLGGGYIADLIDKRLVLAAAYTVAGTSILLFATIYQGWQIFFVLPLFAVGYGTVIPVRAAFQAEYFGLRAYGAIQGMVFTVGTLGGVLGPILAGWIFDQSDTYRLAFLLVAAGTLLGVPLVLSVGRPRQGVRPPPLVSGQDSVGV
jgi:MFS family permease